MAATTLTTISDLLRPRGHGMTIYGWYSAPGMPRCAPPRPEIRMIPRWRQPSRSCGGQSGLRTRHLILSKGLAERTLWGLNPATRQHIRMATRTTGPPPPPPRCMRRVAAVASFLLLALGACPQAELQPEDAYRNRLPPLWMTRGGRRFGGREGDRTAGKKLSASASWTRNPRMGRHRDAQPGRQATCDKPERIPAGARKLIVDGCAQHGYPLRNLK